RESGCSYQPSIESVWRIVVSGVPQGASLGSILFVIYVYDTDRYLATNNTFVSLHFEDLLGESTIRQIVFKNCDALWKIFECHPPT
ncbi:hypothetical protein Hamer_G009112, partial [Homarus americanus]